MKEKNGFKKVLLLAIICLIGVDTNAQQSNNTFDILVYFMPDSVEFPPGIQRLENKNALRIQSKKIEKKLKKMNLRAVSKSFPGFEAADTLLVSETGKRVKMMDLTRVFSLSFDTKEEGINAIDSLNNTPGILFAEPELLEVEPSGTVEVVSAFANDSRVPEQWHLNNTGQVVAGDSGTVDADIDAFEAWTIFTGDGTEKIAVIGTGVDFTQADLVGTGTGDAPDPIINTSQGRFRHSHETHIAGLVAARIGAGDVRGVNSNASVISKRIFTGTSSGGTQGLSVTATANKIIEAINEGARILNNSYEYASHSSVLRNVHASAYKLNRLNVASMGNTNGDSPSVIKYPAAYGQGILTVGNTDNEDKRNTTSRTGAHIDVVAPGTSLLSTYTSSTVTNTTMTGTSQAAGLVSGIASLLFEYSSVPLANDDVENLIKLSAEDVDGSGGYDINYGHGRVNAHQALQRLQSPYILTHHTATGGNVNSSTSVYTHAFIGVPGLANGSYTVERKEVLKYVVFPYMSEVHVWGRGVYSDGYSIENPNHGMGFVEATNITNNSAVLRTYVYRVWTGSQWKYYPAAPENIDFAYTVHGIPGTPPLAVSVTGPTYLTSAGTYQYSASASGGTPPYNSYSWYIRSAGSGFWSYIGSGTTQSVTFTTPHDKDLKVLVEDDNLNTEEDVLTIYTDFPCVEEPGELSQACKKLPGTEEIPSEFELDQNYPNPFNPSTTIPYALPEPAEVVLTIYDIMGRPVTNLVNTVQPAGYHQAVFNAGGLASGMYIAQLTVTGQQSGMVFSRTFKMQLVK